MTTATDITALKARCTALEKRATATETKNTALSTAATALTARVAKLEAVKPVDLTAVNAAIAALTARVAALEASPLPPNPPGEPAATVTYGAGTITNPNNYSDGAVVAGAGIGVTILNGHLDFGSNQEFRDMTIVGSSNSAAANKSGATTTTFRRCRFRGGAGTGYGGSVLTVGNAASCDHITFKDCFIERNLGTENASFSLGYNNITIKQRSYAFVSFITFDGCTLGGNNGVAAGAPRFNVECDVASGSTEGWHDITFNNCLCHAANGGATLDFSENPAARASNVTLTNNVIHSGYVSGATPGWGCSGVMIEMPLNALIDNNDIDRGYLGSLVFTDRNQSAAWTGPNAVVTNNRFDFTSGGAHAGGESYVTLVGAQNCHFHGNTFNGGAGAGAVFNLWTSVNNGSNNNGVSGNTFTNRGGVDAFWVQAGSTGNTLTPNTGA